MITLTNYFMGRDKTHAAELTAAMRADAAETARRVIPRLTKRLESLEARS